MSASVWGLGRRPLIDGLETKQLCGWPKNSLYISRDDDEDKDSKLTIFDKRVGRGGLELELYKQIVSIEVQPYLITELTVHRRGKYELFYSHPYYVYYYNTHKTKEFKV